MLIPAAFYLSYKAQLGQFDTAFYAVQAIELIAAAGGAGPGREAAQAWLRRTGYQPSRIELPLWAVDLTRLVPWLHHDDHPAEDLAAGRMQVSLPAALEDFLRQRWPAAERLAISESLQAHGLSVRARLDRLNGGQR